MFFHIPNDFLSQVDLHSMLYTVSLSLPHFQAPLPCTHSQDTVHDRGVTRDTVHTHNLERRSQVVERLVWVFVCSEPLGPVVERLFVCSEPLGPVVECLVWVFVCSEHLGPVVERVFVCSEPLGPVVERLVYQHSALRAYVRTCARCWSGWPLLS